MASFLLQVQGITQLTVGDTPTNDELSQFLVDGTKEVVNKIITARPDEVSKFTKSSSDTANNGITISGEVISVVREHDSATILRPCNPIDPGHRYEATDSSSLRYRSKYNPGFYELDGKIFLVPISATSNNAAIVTQVYYAINTGHSSSSIDNFPDEYEYLVVLYASMRTIHANMGAKTIASLSITAVIPDTPRQPTFTLTLSESLPTYTKLISSYDPGAPTDLSATYDWSQSVTDIGAFTGITSVAPDSPSLTTMAFAAAGADAAVTSISTDNANVTNLSDPGEGTVTLPTAPVYVPPAPPDRPDFETSVAAEDSEIVAAKAQQYQTDLGAYQAEIGDAVNEFNEANALYQAGIQKALADAQQDNAMILQSLQKNLTIAQADASASNSLEQANKAAAMQNAVTNMTKIVNENNFFIQEWQQGLAVFQAEVGSEIQDYQLKLSKYTQEIQTELTVWQQRRQGELAEHGQKISRFQALVADELNAFNAGIQKYQAEIATKLQEAQYEDQAHHVAILQQYQAEVATYGAEVTTEVQDWQADLQAAQAEYTWLQDQYNRIKAEYDASFQALGSPRRPEGTEEGARA